MTLRKKKLTKSVWFDDVLWKVEQVLSPNKYNDFLVLSRKNDDSIHEDGETVPVEMVLIDAHNDIFFPNTKRVRELMEKRNKVAEKYHEVRDRQNRELSSVWCDMTVHHPVSRNPHIGSEFRLEEILEEEDPF